MRIRTEILQLKRVNEKDNKESIELLEETLDNLESVKDIAETNTELKPFKIFGITASSSMTMSILSGAVSFYSVLISLYSAQGAAVASDVTGL